MAATLIYAANRGVGEKLWRVDASGGSPRNVLAGGRNPAFPAVAPAGSHLAFTETPARDAIWRIDLNASDPASSARLLIRSEGREYAPSWSPDGKKIANISSQTGGDEIWVGDANGNHRAPVTHLKDVAGSSGLAGRPMAATFFSVVRGNGSTGVERAASDGQPRPSASRFPEIPINSPGRMMDSGSTSVDGADWEGSRGRRQQQKLTNNWGDSEPEESPDGKYVYFRRDRSIWRIPAAGGAKKK